MKDAFMPIVLTVLVIIVAIFFIMKIYTPQKETVSALADTSDQVQTSLVALADEDGSEVTGAMVKAIAKKYDVTKEVTVTIKSGSNEIDLDKVKNEDIYIKKVERNTSNKSLEKIEFEKKK